MTVGGLWTPADCIFLYASYKNLGIKFSWCTSLSEEVDGTNGKLLRPDVQKDLYCKNLHIFATVSLHYHSLIKSASLSTNTPALKSTLPIQNARVG